MSKKVENAQSNIRFAVLAVDTVTFTLRDGTLLVRLMKVHLPPYFKDMFGLPGGLVRSEETAEETAMRIVQEKGMLSIKNMYLEQLATYSRVDRDPRGRVVSVGYIGLIPWEALGAKEQNKMENTEWMSIKNIPNLAYDHNQIVQNALTRLRSLVTYTTLISKLLPKEFTLTELENAFESILGKDIDKRNFRKKLEKLNILKKLPHKRSGMRHRPATLYTFKSEKVVEMEVL